MSRPLFTALVGAATLVGCDAIQPQTDSVLVPIERVTVSEIREGPVVSDDLWDADGSGPDVFIEIQTNTGDFIYRSEIQQDVDPEASVTFAIPGEITTLATRTELSVTAFDFDESFTGSERIGRSLVFTVGELSDADEPLMLEDQNGFRGFPAQFEIDPR